MPRPVFPLQVLIAFFAGWLNREQQKVIDYLRAENQVLRELHGKRPPRLNDDQRRRLAVKAVALGRTLLATMATIVTPETLLGWHRKLIARKWTHPRTGPGRPPVMLAIRAHIVQMARANPQWGYDRIRGALRNIGHVVAKSTVARVLAANGIAPAPERPMTWRAFLRSHAEVIAAVDFFTTEVWTTRGLVTCYTLFAIDLRTRVVEMLGSTLHPDGAFMAQVARNIIDPIDGFLRKKRYLLADRDTKFTARFRAILEQGGVHCLRLPVAAPNSNAYAERFVRSIKSECLDRLILIGEGSLHRALREYVAHYNRERNHQGVGNRLLQPDPGTLGATGPVECRKRLGGLLRYYFRRAAA